ncbi:uncharacterized protein LOC142326477 [Lycorma delicatula]|uniref:uncharacterized protein LOC142326477 n=1 Tax=Lycorma delicatula TaxID=130591 RepID=UPI003F514144
MISVNIKVIFHVHFIFISFFLHQILASGNSEEGKRPITSFEKDLLNDFNTLADFYKQELDLEFKDISKGIIHVSVTDFSNALLVKKEEVESKHPKCVEKTESVSKDILDKISLSKNCFDKLHEKVDEAKKLCDNVKTISDLDKLSLLLLEYRKTKNSDIATCFKKSYDYAFTKKTEEVAKIDSCVKDSN